MDWAKATARRDDKHLSFGFGVTYIRGLAVLLHQLGITSGPTLKHVGQ